MTTMDLRHLPMPRMPRSIAIAVAVSILLHALLLPTEKAEGIPDERIRAAVLAAMRKEPWADTYYIMVDVKDGAVTFHGFSRSDATKKGLRVLAEGVPGVISVTDETQPLPMYLYAAS